MWWIWGGGGGGGALGGLAVSGVRTPKLKQPTSETCKNVK